jgi:hypothetical protein
MLQEIDTVNLTGIGVQIMLITVTLTINQDIVNLHGIGVLHMPITVMLTMLETVIILVPIIVLVDTTFAPVIMDTSVQDNTIYVAAETTTPVVEITQLLLLSVTVKLVTHNMLDLFSLHRIL